MTYMFCTRLSHHKVCINSNKIKLATKPNYEQISTPATHIIFNYLMGRTSKHIYWSKARGKNPRPWPFKPKHLQVQFKTLHFLISFYTSIFVLSLTNWSSAVIPSVYVSLFVYVTSLSLVLVNLGWWSANPYNIQIDWSPSRIKSPDKTKNLTGNYQPNLIP